MSQSSFWRAAALSSLLLGSSATWAGDGHDHGEAAPAPAAAAPAAPSPAPVTDTGFGKAHASPSVRAFARQLGVDLGRINGSGRKGRKDRYPAYTQRAKDDFRAWLAAQ